MTARRVLIFLLVLCLFAPTGEAADFSERTLSAPDWLLDLLDWIHATLGFEPTSTSQNYGGTITPTG